MLCLSHGIAKDKQRLVLKSPSTHYLQGILLAACLILNAALPFFMLIQLQFPLAYCVTNTVHAAPVSLLFSVFFYILLPFNNSVLYV